MIAVTSLCLADEKLFGDEVIESCTHGYIDGQLKSGSQAVKPAQAAAMCLCMTDELNRTVLRADMDSALKGDTEQLDSKQQAAILKCITSQKTIADNQKKSNGLKSSANWIRIGGITEDGHMDYVDKNSIRKDETGLIRIWVKQEYPLPQKTPYGEIFSENKVSVALNCKEYKSAATTIDYFGKNGKLIREIAIKPSEWSFSESPPDSLRGSLLRDYCKQ